MRVWGSGDDDGVVVYGGGKSLRPKERKGKPKCWVVFSLLLERLCVGGKTGVSTPCRLMEVNPHCNRGPVAQWLAHPS